MLIRHKVADFAAWKASFDDFAPTRRAFGCQGRQLFRHVADDREVLILLAWDDRERARLFAQSDELLEAMRQSGVIDQADWWVLEEWHDEDDERDC